MTLIISEQLESIDTSDTHIYIYIHTYIFKCVRVYVCEIVNISNVYKLIK